MREIVFDTETTGLSPQDGHRLVEIGCIELVNKVETGRTFHGYFNPSRDMPAEAEAVHGLSIRFLADKPLFGDTALDLLEFVGDCPLVAHNATFDFNFLNHELDRAGHPVICLTRMVDTLAIARTRHPGAKHSLDALCSRYGIDRSHRVKHGALLDAQLLAQLYVELSGGRQIGLSLRADPPPPASPAFYTGGASRPAPRVVTVRPPRPHAATAEELVRHSAFVSKLSDPLWEVASPSG
ncbi:DNA polymerase III subunit epsilon [Sphingomonas solaris]|uniref:DNA polymerase III subunit epsilon n=1 Tax=Alterirhizorhabdus solaris TaxID=2529389 RepID=A0A558R3D9_9SPHN|nr:DNA polymerase III subunit epsilon [Sphingomonas solaris]TVV73891.1 DNA polymerase III subunit epsilon [Sphingomonas solaris]